MTLSKIGILFIFKENKQYYMEENEIAKIIVDTAFRVHNDLGPGLFESVYETVLDYELVNEHGLHVLRQPILPVF